MTPLSAATILNGAVGVAAVGVALFSAVVGAMSFFVNAANSSKQTRLQRGSDAYRAVLAWRGLCERVHQGDEIQVADLWDRLTVAREESAYHTAILYGESQPLALKYHELTEAVREAYEEQIVDALRRATEGESPTNAGVATAGGKEMRTRHEYLAAVKSGASLYYTARRLGLKKQLPQPPSWL